MKSAKNAYDGRRSSPKPNSSMPDSYLNSVLTCGHVPIVCLRSEVAIFFARCHTVLQRLEGGLSTQPSRALPRLGRDGYRSERGTCKVRPGATLNSLKLDFEPFLTHLGPDAARTTKRADETGVKRESVVRQRDWRAHVVPGTCRWRRGHARSARAGIAHPTCGNVPEASQPTNTATLEPCGRARRDRRSGEPRSPPKPSGRVPALLEAAV